MIIFGSVVPTQRDGIEKTKNTGSGWKEYRRRRNGCQEKSILSEDGVFYASRIMKTKTSSPGAVE
jgi:hypothetical protein